MDGSLIAAQDRRITHLVLREGHIGGRKDVLIPVDQIARLEEQTVHRKLSKRDTGALPATPLLGR